MSTAVRRFCADDHTIERVAERRGTRTVSLCIPARDEAETLALIVESAIERLIGTVIDEVVVIDDHSSDATARIATEAGARVVSVEDVNHRCGPARGKGNAMWASLVETTSEFVVWCDADVSSFSAEWVAHLVGPMFEHDDLHLVKASYRRPEGRGGGGRTTELVARPLLSLYFPELARVDQPLAGEYAGRRSALATVPFSTGWGVEIALLIDLAARFGPHCIGQIDLGERRHRHHDLATLSIQAAEVTATLLSRTTAAMSLPDSSTPLIRADDSQVPLNLGERPPIETIALGDLSRSQRASGHRPRR